eukprot:gb/GEZN01007323.1/.p1 GENE.gb/GEZN01007323.1/~~gb/GEZN01007323.1/.p1  ORF type:complete len:416 (+),score=31.27 gb/GEZN01007323.1/:62-1249(+)
MSNAFIPGKGDGDIIGGLLGSFPDSVCPQCQESFPPSSKFCQECGYSRPVGATPVQQVSTPVAIKCTGCGETLAPNSKFCNECGTKAAAVPSTKAPTAPAGGMKISAPSGKDWVRSAGPVDDVSGPMCDGCSMIIEDRSVGALGKNWHPHCFKCSQCKQPVTGSSFTMKGDSPICSTCISSGGGGQAAKHTETSSAEKQEANARIQAGKISCSGCGKVVMGDGVSFGSESYHMACLRCGECGEGVDESMELALRNGKPVHKKCAQDIAIGKMKCGGCLKVIEGAYVKVGTVPYHSDCFKCSQCKGSLAKGYVEKNGKNLCGSCATKAPKRTSITTTSKTTGGGLKFNQFTGKVTQGGQEKKAAEPVAAPAPTQFCGECGAVNTGASFCAECGTKV